MALVLGLVAFSSCIIDDEPAIVFVGQEDGVYQVPSDAYSAPVTDIKINVYDNGGEKPVVAEGGQVASRAMMLGIIPVWNASVANPDRPNFLPSPISAFTISRIDEDGTETPIEDCFEYYNNTLYHNNLHQLHFESYKVNNLVSVSGVCVLQHQDSGFYLVAINNLNKLEGQYRIKTCIRFADGSSLTQVSLPVNVTK